MAETMTRPVAIVSGSARGIGAACARRFAAEGFNLVVNYTRSAEAAEATARACRDAGAAAVVVQGDVADDADCVALVAAAERTWGRLDVLVNNAGVTRFGDPADLATLNADDFARVFAVNVTGAYQLARAAAPLLRAATSGAIVNVSSHSGFSGIGSSIAYAASKGALNTLTLSLARSLAPDVRVNAVCPGFVDTQWLAGRFDDDALAALKRRTAEIAPLRRLVSPAEVAEAVSWFALGGRSITGQLLVIDGGTHLTVGDPL
jgi:3-oxoacyl-[acyl-carrier protein] reductase